MTLLVQKRMTFEATVLSQAGEDAELGTYKPGDVILTQGGRRELVSAKDFADQYDAVDEKGNKLPRLHQGNGW